MPGEQRRRQHQLSVKTASLRLPSSLPPSRLRTEAAVSRGHGLEYARAHECSLLAPESEGSLTNWCEMEV